VSAGDAGVEAELEVLEKRARDPMAQDEREAAIRRLGELGKVAGAKGLLALVVDPFEHLADHVVSAWSALLAGPEGAEVQTFLTKSGLGHKDPRVRAAAATALGSNAGAELADAFRATLAREEDPAVIVALARGARGARGGTLCPEAFLPLLAHADGAAVLAAAETVSAAPDAAEAALRRTLLHKEPLARAGALLGLQQARRLTQADLGKVLADKAPEPRVALAETLEQRTPLLPFPGAGEEVLSTLLKDPSWRVRAAAIEAAVRLWHKSVVVGLIERLALEPGRLHGDAHQALRVLTAQDLADDPDLWRAWWAQKGTDFDPGPRPQADRFGRLRRSETQHVALGGGQAETRTTVFFDLPLRSERLVFVFDLSGSMAKSARVDGDVSGSTETKLDVARREFEGTLAALPESAQLDLLVYRYPTGFPPSPRVTRAFGQALPLSAPNRKKAGDWLRQQNAKGWGAFYEALLAASEGDVDTLVLLSDGVPSRGRYARPARLLEEWVRANRFRRVALHTVLIGERATDRQLMEDVAWASGGLSSVAKRAK
jgi:hypothetical protein